MITVNKDRSVYIPESDRHIGFENDNLVETRYFEIADSELTDFYFKLDIAPSKDIIDLEKRALDDGKNVLVWNITRPAIGGGGIIKAQLRGFDETGERVWHSAPFELVAEESVNGDTVIEQAVITEFEQLEARVSASVSQAEQFSNSAYTYSVVAGIARDNASLYELNAGESAKASESSAVEANEYMLLAKGYAETATEAADLVEGFEENFGDAEAIASQAKAHYESKDNPHNVTAEQVGTYGKEHIDGIGVQADTAYTMLGYHQSLKDNPHNVTAEQLGVYLKDEVNLMFEEFGGVEVDELIDGTSENPVANKVLYARFAEIDEKIGDIDTALDGIIAIQNELIGGDA